MKRVDRHGLMKLPAGTLYIGRVHGHAQLVVKGETQVVDGADSHWLGADVGHVLANEPAALGPIGRPDDWTQYFVLERKDLNSLGSMVERALAL